MPNRPDSLHQTTRSWQAPFRRLTLAATALVLMGAIPTVFRADAANVSVSIGSNWFCSSAFQNGICDTNVNRGDTVIWNWTSGTHNVTECGVNWGKGTSCTGADWASPTQSSGSSFSRPFNAAAGTTYYRCTIHPTAMRGRIIAADPDSDGDGWSNYLEGLIGTDPAASCPSSPSHNAWPADINNDGFVDIIGDISALAGVAFQSVPPAPARFDIAPDPPDGFIDIIGDISRLTGLFGQSCPP